MKSAPAKCQGRGLEVIPDHTKTSESEPWVANLSATNAENGSPDGRTTSVTGSNPGNGSREPMTTARNWCAPANAWKRLQREPEKVDASAHFDTNNGV